MSGHSHWSTIKRKKGASDAKRGKMFSKFARNIMIAAKTGGGKPDMNIRLQYAIEKAKAANMPKDNIERAIQKGVGATTGGDLSECLYEGYGPSGVAIMLEIVTDNKNRTASEIRKMFDMCGGSLGVAGSVSWMFEEKGIFTVNADNTDEDQLMLIALDAGAEDVLRVEHVYQVICAPAEFERIKKVLAEKDITVESSEISWVPTSFIELDEASGKKVVQLMDTLEDHDDVQEVYANFNLPKELLVEMQEER
ncbi:MAG: YebC/PmpR family DNA-binding transcriptional regulator [Planctomycetes bacterium]|nr:YebC/PmpR family DNA-binding transcriptional regulator [Planctomycetota bacterium]